MKNQFVDNDNMQYASSTRAERPTAGGSVVLQAEATKLEVNLSITYFGDDRSMRFGEIQCPFDIYLEN